MRNATLDALTSQGKDGLMHGLINLKNMHKKLETLLIEAGMTETEVKVYLELLKKPSQNKWELVNRTGLDKNQVYRAFDGLNMLKMIKKDEAGIEPQPLDSLIKTLELSRQNIKNTIEKLKKFSPFLKIPTEAVADFQILDTQEKILEKYLFMSETEYDTCLDFGDLNGFIPTIGGLDPAFKFRDNRYKKGSDNEAICTTTGAYSACIMRKNDMEFYKSQIDQLKIDFKDKWIIFSDNNDHVLYNNFEDKENPTSVLINSKVVADMERSKFDLFQKNLQQYS